MHNVADVKAEYPVICTRSSNTKVIPRSYLEPLILLQSVHLFKRLERYPQLLLISRCEVFITFFRRHVAELLKFFLDGY